MTNYSLVARAAALVALVFLAGCSTTSTRSANVIRPRIEHIEVRNISSSDMARIQAQAAEAADAVAEMGEKTPPAGGSD